MIRPLRDVHRAFFTVMVLALPAMLGAVLLLRPAPMAIAPGPASPEEAWSIRIERAKAGAPAMRVTIDRPASSPEVLVYLDEAAATVPGPTARFLGTLAAARTTFDAQADSRGQILLYSPALQRSVARQALAGDAP